MKFPAHSFSRFVIQSYVAATAFLASTLALRADEVDQGWHFNPGISITSGFSDLIDEYEQLGYETEFEWPVGLTFDLYYDFGNGLGIGGGLGPAIYLGGDLDVFVLPVGLDARYTFYLSASTGLYVRGGARYNIADGDYLGDSRIGPFAAIGINFGRGKKIGWGIELSYDGSSVDVDRTYPVWIAGGWTDGVFYPSATGDSDFVGYDDAPADSYFSHTESHEVKPTEFALKVVMRF